MSKRERIFCVTMGIILTALIETMSSEIIHYNLVLRVISTFAYWSFSTSGMISICGVIKKKHVRYHIPSIGANLSFLLTVFCATLTFCGVNTSNRVYYAILFAVSLILAIIFFHFTMNYEYEHTRME